MAAPALLVPGQPQSAGDRPAREAAGPGKLAAAVCSVMQEASALPKDGRNAYHNYRYTSDDAVVNAIRPLLAKHGLAIIPVAFVTTPGVRKTKEGELQHVTLDATYRLLHTSGESIDVPIVAEGADNLDKAVPKALTMARKYLLTQLFQLGSADDPDRGQPVARPRSERPAAGPQQAASDRVEGERQKLWEVLLRMLEGDEKAAHDALQTITSADGRKGIRFVSGLRDEAAIAAAYAALRAHPTFGPWLEKAAAVGAPS